MIILVKGRLVDIHWTNMNKEWYIGKGYEFTKIGDVFSVKAEDLSPGSNIKVDCVCDYCGKIINIAYAQYLKHTDQGQKKCACFCCKESKRSEYSRVDERERCFNTFLSICIDNGYIPVSTLRDYHNSKSLLRYICPIHGEQESSYNHIQRKRLCPKCGNARSGIKGRIPISEVINIVNSKNNNTLLNPDDYISVSTSNLKIKCGSCGDAFITSLASIQAGMGSCPKCKHKKIGNASRHTPDYVKNVIESKNNNILLNPDDYRNATTKNLLVKCGVCGNTFLASLSNYTKNLTGKCPDCNEISYGEYLIACFLDKSNIKYERQKKFDGCKDVRALRFDFYLPKFNLCIEFDGYQHYHEIYEQGVHERSVAHDKIKNEYCKQNSIDLLRIPYWETKNIESIIMDKLNLVA